MADVSAVPENLYRYSDVCTQGAEQLQTWVRTVLAPTLMAYQNGGGFCEPIDGRIATQVAAAYYTDRDVRSVGLAFQQADGPGGGGRKPGTPISAPEAAVSSALERLQREGQVPTPAPGMPPPSNPARLSYELWDANFLPPPSVLPPGSHFSREQLAVLSWVEAHKNTILWEARARNIDPKAIVAAIAWEAIENPRPLMVPVPPFVPGIGRNSSGPGKVHVDAEVVKEIEAPPYGYLPARSIPERDAVLHTAEGSIKYIAAIMGAYADVVDNTKPPHPPIRYDVPVLTNVYHGGGPQKDLKTWVSTVQGKPENENFRYGNDMAVWAARNGDFLNAAERLWQGTEPTPPPDLPPPKAPTPTPGSSPTPR
ncbi:hypothetical protein ABT174_08320 [Streptomyces sparsogenes]|uniref:hypothetical protein n=1 Tax=Streptomyces sparsogenes TaxID=67365 RepID=UPI003321CBE7